MSILPHTKKRRRPGPRAAGDSDTPRRTVRLSLQSLEVARGHDGFLRGKPEPVLLVAAYRTGGKQAASLVGRLLLRARLAGPIPCNTPLVQQELHYDARFAPTESIVVLALAIEENSGQGVQALYAALETPGRFVLYDARVPVPVPRALEEWGGVECAAPAAQPVEVLLGDASLEQWAGSDEYIAAAALSVSTQARSDEVWRLPFIARDARNDWTLIVRLRVVL